MSRKKEPCLCGRSRHSVSINARHAVNRCMQIQRSVCPWMDYRGWGLKSYLIDLIVDVGALSQMSGGMLGALPESPSWWWGFFFCFFLRKFSVSENSTHLPRQQQVSNPIPCIHSRYSNENISEHLKFESNWVKENWGRLEVHVFRCGYTGNMCSILRHYLRFQVYNFILGYC